MDYNLTDNSAMFLNALPGAVTRALEAIGQQAEGYAKMKCPVDTGNLRNSITHATLGHTEYIGTNVYYAPYVEMGTYKMDARPFLKPAATEHSSEYKAIAKQYLQD